MTAGSPATLLRRFLILRTTRWLPTGLLIPVMVLYLVDGGLSLAQLGGVFAAQGIVVMILELPTGGLADAIGRRRVLLLAAGFDLLFLGMLIVGGPAWWIGAAFAAQGVYRALESGPLDAWYVDAAKWADPDTDIEDRLAKGGVVIGLAIAAGALAGGALVAWDPSPSVGALRLPLVISLALRLVDTALVALLMTEGRPSTRAADLSVSLAAVPGIVGGSLRLLRGGTALAALVAVELFWGFGMASFEGLFPVRLSEVLGSPEGAASLLGPLSAGAWVASAVGAATIGSITKRVGSHVAAAGMRIAQGGTVVAMGILTGPVGLAAAYLGCLAVHGAANPVHAGLLHDEAESSNRATVMSLNSLAAQTAGAGGSVVLGIVADRAGTGSGMLVGAVVLAAAAPLYLVAQRRSTVRWVVAG